MGERPSDHRPRRSNERNHDTAPRSKGSHETPSRRTSADLDPIHSAPWQSVAAIQRCPRRYGREACARDNAECTVASRIGTHAEEQAVAPRPPSQRRRCEPRANRIQRTFLRRRAPTSWPTPALCRYPPVDVCAPSGPNGPAKTACIMFATSNPWSAPGGNAPEKNLPNGSICRGNRPLRHSITEPVN